MLIGSWWSHALYLQPLFPTNQEKTSETGKIFEYATQTGKRREKIIPYIILLKICFKKI